MKITKYLGWRVRLGIQLVLIAGTLYVINYALFHDYRNLFFYLGIDIAFLPIEVLFVVLVIESAITEREKSILLEKLNFHITVQGFGVQGWKSKFREVDYRDSTVVEQIRDTRLRNGSWTLNRLRAEIGEPPVDGGYLPVLVDRQNLVVWSDVEALSKATVASKGGTPPTPDVGGPPVPGQAPPAEMARQRSAVREALRAYHAAGRALYEDVQSGVYSQMARSFPAPAIAWVKATPWDGPQMVPLDQVDMSDKDQWDASREPGKVAMIAAKMRRKAKKGQQPRPAVLVRWPGSGKDVIVDGHHHVLAAEREGQHFVWAYVGHVDSEKGPWLDTASREIRKKAA